jgi:hypothetical protein
MHENREISSTPWSDDQGRSAKAINQTADTHVLEKSDCAVLPVNQPNKEGQPSAETGEGRAQTKENIVQSHMHPTQGRKSLPLRGVRVLRIRWFDPVAEASELPDHFRGAPLLRLFGDCWAAFFVTDSLVQDQPD